MNNGMTDKGKSPLASKTVWLGLITALTSILASTMPVVGDMLNEHWEGVGVVLGAVIIVLRGLTGRPIRLL